ncbi:MAG TPA: NnrS family protein, partial [Thermoanaerobaculia bacterium]|nr:NnrS family protein [Thermoanaerobaculia bacterium]
MELDASLAAPATAPRPLELPRLARLGLLGGIAVTLTAGATWGALLLLRLAAAGSFTALSVFEVNAHGQAQIYGWVGLVLLGVGYLLVPRMLGVALARPRLAARSLAAMAAGTVLRAVSEPFAAGGSLPAAPLALAGALLQFVAAALFLVVVASTLARRSGRRPVDRWLLAAGSWFVTAAALDLVHLARLAAAPSRENLLAQLATWQLPLRAMQVQGVMVSAILGMSLFLLPMLFGRKKAAFEIADAAWWPFQVALAAQIVAFVAFMSSGWTAWAGVLRAAQVLFAVAALTVAGGFRLWRRQPRSAAHACELRFVVASHLWLAVSLAMTVAAPLWSAATGHPFSHAWTGAARHAITVGFVSLSIVGFGSRIAALLSGRPLPPRLLTAVLVLLNTGCALRVTMQSATDWTAAAFPV